ncbi:hypothetical protein PLICRDRAFT_108318 [Plicaturopsis crispa FD-325 SS-3]|nr:hypothetical protein PLICRDRAFT_108318 [Plicaturopsis crispa FD-325 SS-3]
MRSPPPPAKRRCVGRPESAHDASASQPAPFYFKDGNIILSVERRRFRVHHTRLQCSDIFSDMMGIPQPLDTESVDGCPIVELSDTARDWMVVLKWIYDPAGFIAHPVTFDILSGALRISTKYEIAALRQWDLDELYSRWPHDTTTMTPNALPHAAEAISLARECDVPEILPAAFYALSVQRWSCGADGGRSHVVMSPADLRRFISGRESLQTYLMDILIDPLCEEDDRYHVCEGCRAPLEQTWRTMLAPDPTAPWGCWLLRELARMLQFEVRQDLALLSVCAACVVWHQTLAQTRIVELKRAIPRFFLL